MNPPTDKLVRVKEIAWRLGLSRWTFSRNEVKLGFDKYRVDINSRVKRYKPTVWLLVDRLLK